MKTIILAGGYGTRLAEETSLKPKPMIEIGNRPMLWHIMKLYSYYGYNDFVIACGYKAEVIKQYFANIHLLNNDYCFNTMLGTSTCINNSSKQNTSDEWQVACIDTGIDSLTGMRVKKLQNTIGNNRFMMTYGDGISNVDIKKLIEFHKSHKKIATVTAVRPKARFGTLNLKDNNVVSFSEKKQIDVGWINGGFFIFEPEIFDYITQNEPLEQAPLTKLAEDGELMAYYHTDFWQPVDTLNEKNQMNKLWENNQAPWKVWDKTHISDNTPELVD